LGQGNYGRVRVLAKTNEWLIHDNSSNGCNAEFAILKSDDFYEVILEVALQDLLFRK